ncbi:MAG: tetratricopeptide repeat protein, partial [Cyanobacteria bacterium P01_F01_bin.3]
MVSEASAKLFQRALSLIKVERPFDALPLLSQLIEAEPEWAEVYVQRARIRKRVGDKERAIADYAKAIKLDPKAETYLARALVWLELNQIKGAIADSRQVIALKPQLAGGYRVLGKALGLLGDFKAHMVALYHASRDWIGDNEKFQIEIKNQLVDVFNAKDELLLDPAGLSFFDNELNKIDLKNAKRDPFGDLYEVFIGTGVREEEGQFFTPKNGIDL